MKSLNLGTYKTSRGAATALHRVLQSVCRQHGMDPDIELSLMDPDRSEQCGYGRVWRVMWESGPHDWGVVLSCGGDTAPLLGVEIIMGGWHMEPYYGFDVGFYE